MGLALSITISAPIRRLYLKCIPFTLTYRGVLKIRLCGKGGTPDFFLNIPLLEIKISISFNEKIL